jgi:translation initiation factor 2 subunit 1
MEEQNNMEEYKIPEQKEKNFYKQDYPEEDTFVLCQIESVDKTSGIHVTLLEYSNIPGMVHLGEISKKRRFNLSSMVKVGNKEVLLVNSVDIDRNEIDLSKKRVTQEDRQKCNKKFSNAKLALESMRHVSRTLEKDLDELMETVIWPNFKPENDFRKSFWSESMIDIIDKDIHDVMAQKISKPKVSAKSVVHITCFTEEGITAIKESFEGLDKRLVCTTITPPEYSVTIKDYQGTVKESEDFLKEQLKIISKNITERSGTFALKSIETVQQ